MLYSLQSSFLFPFSEGSCDVYIVSFVLPINSVQGLRTDKWQRIDLNFRPLTLSSVFSLLYHNNLEYEVRLVPMKVD